MADDAIDVDSLIAQGCCCGSGCENCPYIDDATHARHVAGTTTLNQVWVDYKHANPDKTFHDWQASVGQPLSA
ncbi:MAG TPA: hypothetical protein VLH19_05220 [Patescibacteria group bacterium]|nr:hypothetical protein [Patescibacteria group bacterium]